MNMMQIKLPEAVTDNTLKTISEFEFYVNGEWDAIANNNRISIRLSQSSTIRIVEGSAHFTNSQNTEDLGRTISIPANTTTYLYISSGSAKILVGYKDSISSFTAPSGRQTTLTNDINYFRSNRINYLNLDRCYFEYPFDIKKFTDLYELRVINSRNSQVFNLNDIKVLDVLQLLGTNATILGEVSALGRNYRLSEIRLEEATGAVEDLFDDMVNNGRTSGTLLMIFSGGTVTYQGSIIRSISATFNSEGWSVNRFTTA
jgi:hypothetical protein